MLEYRCQESMHLPQYTYSCVEGITRPHLMQWHRTVSVVADLVSASDFTCFCVALLMMGPSFPQF